eukprot:m.10045 g.10045  ORF g.10045 m.10045 type:complete len:298 (+) comp21863_c0_seq1:246-1139(+)
MPKRTQDLRNRLDELTLKLKSHGVTVEVLKEKEKELEREKADLLVKLNDVKRQRQVEQAKFLEEMSNFSETYDLTGECGEKRGNEWKCSIEQVRGKLKVLEDERNHKTSQTAHLENLIDISAVTETENVELSFKSVHLDYALDGQDKVIRALESQKRELEQWPPRKDSVRKGFQGEWDTCEDDDVETLQLLCSALQSELEELKNSCLWNKEPAKSNDGSQNYIAERNIRSPSRRHVSASSDQMMSGFSSASMSVVCPEKGYCENGGTDQDSSRPRPSRGQKRGTQKTLLRSNKKGRF